MRYIVFDLETQNFFSEVGSSDPVALDISVASLYDSETDSYTTVTVDELHKLWPIIEKAYGSSIKRTADFYRAYAAVYFGDAASNDAATYPALYPWCVEQLKKYHNKIV